MKVRILETSEWEMKKIQSKHQNSSSTWSDIFSYFSPVFQLSHYHRSYEYPPIDMEHQKCYKHGIKDVVHDSEIFFTWHKLYGEITAILINGQAIIKI